MDITFDCPRCGRHLVIDSKGSRLVVACPACSQPLTIPDIAVTQEFRWQEVRTVVLNRDNHRCVACGTTCARGEADVHHLMPRDLGGSDDPANLVTLCDGCHAAHHPNL